MKPTQCTGLAQKLQPSGRHQGRANPDPAISSENSYEVLIGCVVIRIRLTLVVSKLLRSHLPSFGC